MNIIPCKKNLARSIHHLVRFLAMLYIEIGSKLGMHIEQCNVVVIIKYEIKSMKTLEDTIS